MALHFTKLSLHHIYFFINFKKRNNPKTETYQTNVMDAINKIIFNLHSIRILLFCFSLSFLSFSISAKESINTNGYIITHDKKQIEGKIVDLYYSNLGCQLTFVNVGGDEYFIHPILIRGFVFSNEKGEVITYVSRYYNRKWFFLRMAYKGSLVNLLLSPDRKVHFGTMFDAYNIVERNNTEYWLEFRKKDELVRLYPNKFRRTMRKRLSKYPDIRNKIGKKGYRLKNIFDIIKELERKYGDESLKSI